MVHVSGAPHLLSVFLAIEPATATDASATEPAEEAAPPEEAAPAAADPEPEPPAATSPTPAPEPAPAPAPAKPLAMPKHSIVYNDLLPLRLNPLGLENRINIDYRYRLYDTASKLKDGAHIGFGVEPVLNPALTRVSAMLTVQPLAILRLRAAYGLLAHFGTFDFMQSYNTPTADYYTAEYESTTDTRYPSVGTQLQLAALLQAKVGPIAIRNDLQTFRTDVPLRDRDGDGRPDTVFYFIRDDMMIQGTGWHLINDSDILYMSGFGLTAGVRSTVVKAFYDESAFRPGESTEDPNGPAWRLGPLLAYTFYDRPVERRRFNKPAILLISQWHLKHRYRATGSPALSSDGTVERGSLGDSIRGMPTIVLGFSFQGELWSRG